MGLSPTFIIADFSGAVKGLCMLVQGHSIVGFLVIGTILQQRLLYHYQL